MLLPHELKIILLLLNWKKCLCAFEGNIVGGNKVDIKYFPHSATIKFIYNNESHLCGASMLNNRVLLTAAHCLECVDACIETRVDIVVTVGSSDRNKGKNHVGLTFYSHEEYDPYSDVIQNDIGLVGVHYIKFSENVARVSIMRNPPYNNTAYVAGWGLISEEPKKKSPILKKLLQSVMSYAECKKYIYDIPKGTICGGKITSKTYTAYGDSGSALIVDDYIQIGIVSHKDKAVSNGLSVYTDVGYHYEWIRINAKMVYCSVLKARNLQAHH